MKWLNRLRCELQDHIRVTETTWACSLDGNLNGCREHFHLGPASVRAVSSVTRCTRCGWTSRRAS